MKSMSLDNVSLLDGIFEKAKKSDISFLEKIEPDRLLSNFRKNSGLLDKGVPSYNGWEKGRLAGHTLGHYLVAIAQLAFSEGDTELGRNMREKIDYIVHELKLCQDANGKGLIFGAALDEGEDIERQFDIDEGRLVMEAAEGEMLTWVPWYNLHKTFEGLLAAYEMCGNDEALRVARRLADWTVRRTNKWTADMKEKISNGEYGAIDDCLLRLYKITKDDRYKKAAAKFSDKNLMKYIVSEEQNTLMNKHANTTIPKFLSVVSENNDYAEGFWDKVTRRHAYATGGVSDMEHFHEDFLLDDRRTQCNCEGCCAHNMLKLSRGLFEKLPHVKYADYSDRLLHNAILGAINFSDGTTSYFSPMATGYTKTFCDKDLEENKFWCCTGTGMENYTKLQQEIYFYDEKNKEQPCILVNQYIDSQMRYEGSVLKQQSQIRGFAEDGKMTVSFKYLFKDETQLGLRIPYWCSEARINHWGESEVMESEDGYYFIFLEGAGEFTLEFDMVVRAECLPDKKEVVCFAYGPYVLAAKLGKERADEKVGAGIDVVASAIKVVGGWGADPHVVYNESHVAVLPTEVLNIESGERRKIFLENIESHMKGTPGEPMHFELEGTNAEQLLGEPLKFVPYYEIQDERYGIYWYIQ